MSYIFASNLTRRLIDVSKINFYRALNPLMIFLDSYNNYNKIFKMTFKVVAKLTAKRVLCHIYLLLIELEA